MRGQKGVNTEHGAGCGPKQVLIPSNLFSRIAIAHTEFMGGHVFRIILWIELGLLVLLAGLFSLMTFFAAGTTLGFVAFSVVSLAVVATADLTYRQLMNGGAETPILGIRGVIAVGGAILAATMAIYGRLYLSSDERWTQGIDFISVGCLLWIPLSQLAVLNFWGRAVKGPRA